MLIQPAFPPNRLRDPKRKAERRVYREFEESERDGGVLYELKVSKNAPEVDFFAIITGEAVVCLQVKGGQYRIQGGDWYLETDEGPEYTPSLIRLTWDSAMAVRDSLKEKLDRKVFILAILLLPDMEPDPDIQLVAESDDRVAIMYGYRDLVERIVDLAD